MGAGPGSSALSPPFRSPRPDPIGVLSGRLGSPLPSRRGNYPNPRPNSRGPLGTAFPRAPRLSPTLPDWASQTLAHGDRNSPTLPGCADPQDLSGL